jgi:hypothetical protein
MHVVKVTGLTPPEQCYPILRYLNTRSIQHLLPGSLGRPWWVLIWHGAPLTSPPSYPAPITWLSRQASVSPDFAWCSVHQSPSCPAPLTWLSRQAFASPDLACFSVHQCPILSSTSYLALKAGLDEPWLGMVLGAPVPNPVQHLLPGSLGRPWWVLT